MSREVEENLPDYDQDRTSLASFGSGNTTDSDKVSHFTNFIFLKSTKKINLIDQR